MSISPELLGRLDPQVHLPPGPAGAGAHLRRRHGHQPAAAGVEPRGLRRSRPRGLQRNPHQHPPRPDRPGPPLLLRGRLRRRRDRHVRLLPGRAGRVRLADRAREISRTGAEIAKSVAAEFSTPERPRWVAGSMGPGTKFPTLGQIPYADLRDAYEEQALGLLEGGVDLLLIETVFDLLSAKAAINGARRAMAALDRVVPLQVQVTIELTGRMLPGTEIGAALTALERDAGRRGRPQLRHRPGRDERGRCAICLGQPRADRLRPQCRPPVGGRRQDALRPDPRSAGRAPAPLRHRVRGLGRRRLLRHHARAPGRRGGALRRRHPGPPHPVDEPSAASIYTSVPFHQDTSFLVVGERTNANGSKRFREAMLDGRLGHLRGHGPRPGQGGRPRDRRLRRLHRRRRRGRHDRGGQPLRHPGQRAAHGRLDRAPVARAALEWIGGRPILNSVNLEEGDEPGTRLDTFLRLAREFGAAVVCTCIDEEGQARTAEWKLRAARNIRDIAVERYGLASPRTCSSTRWPCPCRPAWRRAATTGSRPSRASGPSRPSCPASPPSSGCPTSRSASTRRPARCSTRCSCTSASRPGSTRPSCTLEDPPAVTD
jgi:hypothetical protein